MHPADQITILGNALELGQASLRVRQAPVTVDSIFPFVAYMTLMAYPPRLYSHIMFALKILGETELLGKAGFVLITFQAAIRFLRTLDIQELRKKNIVLGERR